MTTKTSQLSKPGVRLVPGRPSTAVPKGTAAHGERVALRQLVIATDTDDFQLPAWERILDHIGTPYDVLFAKRIRLNSDRLVRADGVGRYNAVLLTSAALLFPTTSGR